MFLFQKSNVIGIIKISITNQYKDLSNLWEPKARRSEIYCLSVDIINDKKQQ